MIYETLDMHSKCPKKKAFIKHLLRTWQTKDLAFVSTFSYFHSIIALDHSFDFIETLTKYFTLDAYLFGERQISCRMVFLVFWLHVAWTLSSYFSSQHFWKKTLSLLQLRIPDHSLHAGLLWWNGSFEIQSFSTWDILCSAFSSCLSFQFWSNRSQI